MISVMRSLSIVPGKTAEAAAFAKQLAGYIRDKHNLSLEVMMPVGGNFMRIAWYARFQSLAEYETMMGKVLADSEYVSLAAKNAGNFLPGSAHDDIWRTI